MKSLVCAISLLLMAQCAVANPEEPVIAKFSTAPTGAEKVTGWTPTYLASVKQHTRFSIIEDNGRNVLRTDANASAGTLIHRSSFDPRQFPILRWRWKVTRHNPATRMEKKSGDDFPVRLYVFFDYDLGKLGFMTRTKIRMARKLYGNDLPAAALCYVWDPHLPVGTTAWNAYTDRVRMIVTESGDGDRWAEAERNVLQDFKEAFGEDPPRISAIAIAGDSDNTKAHTEAFIGDITFAAR